jgi:DNA-binding MarR family transcriptional regulator
MHELAQFRYGLRKFLRFSEQAATSHGITPQQHQLLLGVAGYTGRGWATISELAEFLQERHNSVVELIGRAVRRGLVRKAQDVQDKRFVFVSLTRKGEAVLSKLSKLHKEQLEQLQAGLLHGVGNGSRRSKHNSDSSQGRSARGSNRSKNHRT